MNLHSIIRPHIIYKACHRKTSTGEDSSVDGRGFPPVSVWFPRTIMLIAVVAYT